MKTDLSMIELASAGRFLDPCRAFASRARCVTSDRMGFWNPEASRVLTTTSIWLSSAGKHSSHGSLRWDLHCWADRASRLQLL